MSEHTKPPWPEIDAGIVDLTIEDYEYARKCVNIHDEIVSALEDGLNYLEGIIQSESATFGNLSSELNDTTCILMRTALSKAKDIK